MIKKDTFEIFAYFLLSGLYIKIIGSLALSEVWVLIMVLFINWKALFRQYSLLSKISFLYGFYFTCQVVSEIVNQNAMNNWTRGLMVTIISYLSFIYLFSKFQKNNQLILIALIAELVKNIIFLQSANIAGAEVDIDFTSYNSLTENFKGRISLILLPLSIIISYYLLKQSRKILTSAIFIVLASVFLAFEARSVGLVLFLCGLLLLINRDFLKNKIALRLMFLTIIVLGYFGYIFWINKVLKKELGGYHSYSQAIRMENPYNPLELLTIGRGEFFVGIQAFKDNPLFGYGSWAIDKTGKYYRILMENDETLNDFNINLRLKNFWKYKMVIPSHSVIVGAAVFNGIFALTALLLLISLFVKIGFKKLIFYLETPFSIIFLTNLFFLIWHSLFSPITHLRLTIPLYFSIILALYYHSTLIQQKDTKNDTQHLHPNLK